MSYEFYKVLHILCIVLVSGFAGAQFFAEKAPKYVKIISGVASLIILVSGMGLIAKIGLPHGAPWPLWIKIKLGLWVLIAGLAPVLGKRLPVDKKKFGYLYVSTMLLITIFVAVTKLA